MVPYPGPGGKTRISTGGGKFPIWSRNGRELFFLDFDSNKIMVTNYQETSDSFVPAKPPVWSDKRLLEEVKFPQAVALLHQWRGLPPLLHEAAGFAGGLVYIVIPRGAFDAYDVASRAAVTGAVAGVTCLLVFTLSKRWRRSR